MKTKNSIAIAIASMWFVHGAVLTVHPPRSDSARAQSAPLTEVKAPLQQDGSHDVPENDPSPQPQLKSRIAIPQLVHAIGQTVRRSFQKVEEKADQIAQKWASPEKGRKTKPTYEELWRSHPEYWQALAPLQHRYFPSAEHGPALVNTDEEFEGITDREYGLCWGFATLLRQFSTLAQYAPNTTVATIGKPRSSKWLTYYKRKIDAVMDGRATVFPGFKNFRELSIVPELELYLKHYTIRLWSSKVIHRTSISIIKNATTPMTRAQITALLTDLENRLARYEMPKILFSSLIPSQPLFGLNTDIHAVLVYGLERLPNGAAKIYVWDINFYAETLIRSPKFIEVLPDGTIRYEPWFDSKVPYAAKSADLSQVMIAPENDREMVDLLLELNRKPSGLKRSASVR